MKNVETQTFRYKIIQWLLFIIWGILCLGIAIGTMVKNFPDLLAGEFRVLDYIGFVFVLITFFPFGLLSFAAPLFAKIVVSAQGIEYHTISAVVKAKWSDLTIGVTQSSSGSSKTFISTQSEIKLRSWAKHVPWDVTSGAKQLGIPFSQFGLFSSQRLLACIDFHAPHLRIYE